MKLQLLILFIVLLIAVLISCKTKQITTVKTTIPYQPDSLLMSKLTQSLFLPEWFSCKAKIDYVNNNNKMSFTANIRMRKDSLIWLSASSILGVEVIRTLIRKDSILVIDRINKKYYQKDFQYLTRFLPVKLNFEVFQAIIFGNEYFNASKRVQPTLEQSQYLLNCETDELFIKEWISQETFKIEKNLINHKFLNYTASVYYDKFEHYNKKLFPVQCRTELISKDTSSILINYSKINIDEPQTFPFTIPANFTKD